MSETEKGYVAPLLLKNAVNLRNIAELPSTSEEERKELIARAEQLEKDGNKAGLEQAMARIRARSGQ